MIVMTLIEENHDPIAWICSGCGSRFKPWKDGIEKVDKCPECAQLIKEWVGAS